MDALNIENLTKTYANGVEAVKGVSISIPERSFYGLLGPNGAGKTTIIGIITDMVVKTSGRIKIFDKDIDKEFSDAKQLIGVVPQEMNFAIFEKVIDIVVQQAGYYGIAKKDAEKNAEKYLRQLGLWDKRDEQAKSLSGGMKRRLMIARALIHEPKLLILDEPTAGVDVELRRDMWSFLTRLNKSGTTIILTTHYLEEAEHLCKRIAIINKGMIIEDSSTKEIINKLDKQSYILDIASPMKKKPEMKGCNITIIDDTTIEIELDKSQNLSELMRLLDKEKITILSMRNKANRLEEMFIDLIENGKEGKEKGKRK
ncbi:ABC transporter ATP-binding protein [Candidatus Woesearchaeota archaeon]|nr:ABC transporter ATP-binding protein [Candidatus Woesearchaeota archaeon]